MWWCALALAGPIDEVRAAQSLMQTDLMAGWAEVQRALATYGPGADAPDPSTDTELEKALGDAALLLHASAREERLREVSLLADTAYDMFEASFPESGRAPQLLFAHGELLLELDRPEEAWSRLSQAAATAGPHDRALFAERALEAAEEASRAEQPRPLGVLTAWDERVLAGCELLAEIAPSERATYALRTSSFLWRRGFPRRSEAAAMTVLELGEPASSEAARHLVRAWTEARDWERIVASHAFESLVTDPQTLRWLREQQLEAEFAWLTERYPLTRPTLEAAESWERWATDNASHERADSARQRAVTHYESIGRPARARRLSRQKE